MLKQILISSAVAAGVGASSGYLAASYAPLPPTMAVMDLEGLVKRHVDTSPNPEASSKSLTDKVKVRAEELASHGIVIIDGRSVISAPEGAYVAVE